MAVSAHINVYREEYIPTFERGQTPLRASCTTEVNVNGKTVNFLVAGSGGATATTRGSNGLITPRSNSNTQTTAVLAEINDLVEGTKFNWDLSQGNQRLIAAQSSAKVIYRKIDQQIIDILDTATVNDSAATMSVSKIATALATLGNANVPIEEEDNMFGLITPSALGYLMQVKEFASSEYVEVKPFAGPARKYRRWMGINWMVHSGLTGVGTASEKCYLYHRSAIGHACQSEMLDVDAGYDGRQKMYWTSASAFAQAALLQNSGVVQMLHNGSNTALS